MVDTENSFFKIILSSFYNYEKDALKYVNKMEKDFKSIGEHYLNILPFNYNERIKKLKEAISLNNKFLKSIIKNYQYLFTNQKKQIETKPNDINKLRTTLTLLIRDWSLEGKKERDLSYNPIIDVLKIYFPDNKKRNNIKILVPGTGLSRLLYEITKLGFDSYGLEVSYYMLMTSNYLLNENITKNQFLIQPYIHSFNNLYKEDDAFKIYSIPDENIKEELNKSSGKFELIPSDFVNYLKTKSNFYEGIVTSFFIDTANNIIEFIELIYNSLKNKGIWVNFGPLLYHFTGIENEISIELSWEDIRKIILKYNFEIKEEKFIQSPYSSNLSSMKQTQYACIYFIVIKK